MALINQDHQKDKDFSNALHGKVAGNRGGFAAILSKDREAQKAHSKEYFDLWEGKNDEAKDNANTEERVELYKKLTNAYYNLATDLYEYGWAQSFHFARYYPGEGFYQALARHEHYLAHRMHMPAGARVLDVGCGVGGPAREIAQFTGAHVTGINNNDYQIERARIYTKKRGLSNLVDFVKGDFMHLPFEDNTFDMVYAIEATVHAPSLADVYTEIARVLKPGGTFGVYEWVMTDAYDDTNLEHRRIKRDIEIGDGIAHMMPMQTARDAFRAAKLDVLYEEDLAATDTSAYPWYYPIEGNLRNCQTLWDYVTCFRMTRAGRFITQTSVGVLEKLGIAGEGTKKVGQSLADAADALVAGGRQKLFTPMYMVICKKPLA